MFSLITLIVSLFSALIAGFITFLLQKKRVFQCQSELDLLQQSYTNLENTSAQILAQKDHYQKQHEENIKNSAMFYQTKEHLTQQLHQIQQEQANKNNDFTTLQQEFYTQQNQLNAIIIGLREENQTLHNQANSKNEEITAIRKEFSTQFENLANRIFDHKSQTFQQQSIQSLEQILHPVRESFGEFKSSMNNVLGKHHTEQVSLKSEIKQIFLLNQNMSKQTEDLTNALKGDNKMQGNWGEMILERLLEEAGLVKGRDYTPQGENMGLVHDATNKRQQPDIIIHLPENKHLIIDSKVSFVHYERYIAQDEPVKKADNLKLFLSSIRNHIKDLSSKEYQDNKKLSSPDFVMLFIPIEGAYCTALQSDPALHQFAWSRRIALVSTSTLFSTLKTVASIWRIENQNRNAEKIAVEAGKIYDKACGFLQSMEDIGRNLGQAQKAYDDAIKKMSTGRGNLISQTQKIKILGVKPKKDLETISIATTALEDITDNHLDLT